MRARDAHILCPTPSPTSLLSPPGPALQIRERYEGMKAEHSRLSKSIAALQGIQGWRTEAVQLEQVRGGVYCSSSAVVRGWMGRCKRSCDHAAAAASGVGRAAHVAPPTRAQVLNWAVVDEAAAAVAARAQVLQSDLPARLAAAQALLAEVQLERQALRQATEDKARAECGCFCALLVCGRAAGASKWPTSLGSAAGSGTHSAHKPYPPPLPALSPAHPSRPSFWPTTSSARRRWPPRWRA